jgi:ribulose 1,5-bisphosphate carboxylase large subunit-like protein
MGLSGAIPIDLDEREGEIRQRVYDDLNFWAEASEDSDAVIGTYFLRTRTESLTAAGRSISYHMTTGVKETDPGTLIDCCTGKVVGVRPWDAVEKLGLVRIAFPARLLQHPDGKFYTTDILHLLAGEGVFGLWEFVEAKLVDVAIPARILETFPGPAYGPGGVRALTSWPEEEPAFGTILKPTAGITDDEVADLVAGVASEPLFMFVKEDENLLPDLDYCPVVSRARKSLEVIWRLQEARGSRGLIFAPHVTSLPQKLYDTVMRVLETGVRGIMFSEQFTGGSVRAVRDWTARLTFPPVIYGHNSGISSRTHSIWREVLDYFARLDGVDFRQTALLTPAHPLLRPQALEWRKCEEVLSKPAGHIKPTMIARAGGLDQGNIIPNLIDAERTLPKGAVLFLAGSAVHSIKGSNGQADAKLGAQALREALELWRDGDSPREIPDLHAFVRGLYDRAQAHHLRALASALEQRYALS